MKRLGFVGRIAALLGAPAVGPIVALSRVVAPVAPRYTEDPEFVVAYGGTEAGAGWSQVIGPDFDAALLRGSDADIVSAARGLIQSENPPAWVDSFAILQRVPFDGMRGGIYREVFVGMTHDASAPVAWLGQDLTGWLKPL